MYCANVSYEETFLRKSISRIWASYKVRFKLANIVRTKPGTNCNRKLFSGFGDETFWRTEIASHYSICLNKERSWVQSAEHQNLGPKRPRHPHRRCKFKWPASTAFHFITSSVLTEWHHLDQCKQPSHTCDRNQHLPWPYCFMQVIQRSEIEGHDIDTSTRLSGGHRHSTSGWPPSVTVTWVIIYLTTAMGLLCWLQRESWIQKKLEGRDHSLLEILFQNLSKGTEGNLETPHCRSPGRPVYEVQFDVTVVSDLISRHSGLWKTEETWSRCLSYTWELTLNYKLLVPLKEALLNLLSLFI